MIIDSGVITGSLVVSGSYNQTGSAVIDGDLTVLGTVNAVISGSVTSASFATSAATASFAPAYLPLVGGTINGNLIVNGTGSFNVVVTNYESSSVIYSSGSTKFGDSLDDTHEFTGSVTVLGGPLQVNESTVILTNQTSSMSVNTAATSSYPFKLQPLSSNQVLYTSYNGMTVGDGMDSSTFLGASAGNGAFFASFSTFVGRSSGLTAASASYSAFLGFQAGEGATEASESVFLGYQAGLDTVNAAGSTFIGYKAGVGAGNSAYSSLVGYKAGTNNIGPNNIVIGTNVSLPVGRRDSINLGGVIFATGSYFNTTNPAYTGSAAGAKVGILVVNPTLATLEIGGNVYAQSFTGSFSGSITAAISSSYALSASYAVNATTAVEAPFYVLTSSFDAFSGSVSTRVSNLESTSSTLTSASASFVVASGSTSTRLTNLESFSSSLDATFATDAQLNAATASLSASLAIPIAALEATASTLTSASASFVVASGSNSIRVTNLEATASTLTSASASFSTRVTNNETTGSSLVLSSGSLSTRVTNLETTSSTFPTVSASFAIVSASFSSTSGSLSIRTTDLESTASSLTSFSASYVEASGSDSTRITNLESTASTLTSASASFASQLNTISGVTGSYATTGSNNFIGNESITGSLNVTGSTILSGSVQVTGSQTITGSFDIAGNTTMTGSLSTAGAVQVSGSLNITGSTILSSSLEVTGSTSITGSLNVAGNSTMTGSLTTAGNVDISGSLGITGSTSITGSLVVDGSQSITGSLAITGSNSFLAVDQIYSGNGVSTPTNRIQLNANGLFGGQLGDVVLYGSSAGVALFSPGGDITISSPTVGKTVQITGSLVLGGGATGSLLGTASFANTADTAISAPYYVLTASYNNDSSSLSIRTTDLENTASILTSASASFVSQLNTISGVTGSYATTGSNTFVSAQYISDTSNAISFLSTASLYTDGGFRVAKDSYFSGSVSIAGDFTVFGTASVNYVTSSTFIGLEFIDLNTDLPALRYAGINVGDSGSAAGVSSSFWYDSENNDWIFVHSPAGSSQVTSSMTIFGPVAYNNIGNEVGITGNYLAKGQLLDGEEHDHHITSSQIYDDGTTVAIAGNLQVTGSLYANSTTTVPFNVGLTSTYYGTVASSIAGTNNVFTLDTGSYTAAKFIYTVAKGTSARMGEVLAVWNGDNTEFTDVATQDINSTTDVVVVVSIVASQLKLNFQTTSTQWKIKSQGTLI